MEVQIITEEENKTCEVIATTNNKRTFNQTPIKPSKKSKWVDERDSRLYDEVLSTYKTWDESQLEQEQLFYEDALFDLVSDTRTLFSNQETVRTEANLYAIASLYEKIFHGKNTQCTSFIDMIHGNFKNPIIQTSVRYLFDSHLENRIQTRGPLLASLIQEVYARKEDAERRVRACKEILAPIVV